MENKNVATGMVISLGLCLVSTVGNSNDATLLTLAGFGLIAFTVLSLVNLHKLEPKGNLYPTYLVSSIAFFVLILTNNNTTLVGQIVGINWWICTIWTIIKLFKNK